MQTCILIGAGEFHESDIIIDHDDYVIAVDGGYRYCNQLGITPHLLVADFDSMERVDFPDIHASIPEKDDSDMMLAIKDGLSKGYRKFQLYGALGGRFEHSYANIQCLAYLLNHDAIGEIIDRDFRITLVDDQIKFTEKYSGYISIYAYPMCAEISIQNLKYTLDHGSLSYDFPLGLDNEFIGKEAVIQIHDGAVLIMYHTPVEICAGCIVLNQRNQVCMTLENGLYQIPKGHLEVNESLQECAIREVKEEVGLDVQIINKHPLKVSYLLREYRPIRKEVTFYLARTMQEEFSCRLEEVQEAYWMTFDEAIEKASKDNIRQVLKEAKNMVEEI